VLPGTIDQRCAAVKRSAVPVKSSEQLEIEIQLRDRLRKEALQVLLMYQVMKMQYRLGSANL